MCWSLILHSHGPKRSERAPPKTPRAPQKTKTSSAPRVTKRQPIQRVRLDKSAEVPAERVTNHTAPSEQNQHQQSGPPKLPKGQEGRTDQSSKSTHDRRQQARLSESHKPTRSSNVEGKRREKHSTVAPSADRAIKWSDVRLSSLDDPEGIIRLLQLEEKGIK